MATAGAWALYENLHKDRPFHSGDFDDWSEQRSPAHPFHYTDGVRIIVTQVDVNPNDAFTTDENASPIRQDSAPGPRPLLS